MKGTQGMAGTAELGCMRQNLRLPTRLGKTQRSPSCVLPLDFDTRTPLTTFLTPDVCRLPLTRQFRSTSWVSYKFSQFSATLTVSPDIV